MLADMATLDLAYEMGVGEGGDRPAVLLRPGAAPGEGAQPGAVHAVHDGDQGRVCGPCGLQLIRAEGLPHVFERHRRMARLVRTGVRGMGLRPLVEDAYAVDTDTTVRMPEGVDGKAVVRHARERYDVMLGGGIDRLEQIVRIGHLGYTRPEWLLAGLEVLGRTLADLGHPVPTDEGLRVAKQALEAAALNPDVAEFKVGVLQT